MSYKKSIYEMEIERREKRLKRLEMAHLAITVIFTIGFIAAILVVGI